MKITRGRIVDCTVMVSKDGTGSGPGSGPHLEVWAGVCLRVNEDGTAVIRAFSPYSSLDDRHDLHCEFSTAAAGTKEAAGMWSWPVREG